MTLLLKNFCVLTIVAAFGLPAYSQIDEKALKEWKDLKYSMFIHWGIYSELGGVWDGKNISRGLSEQIQAHAGIYSDTYAKVAKQFNPTKWNADSVALLARRAGMGSVVITSKHHDGFAMFKTDASDFDVVDATPFGRDVIRELSDACKRHGLKFGLYFSLIDWHFPQASPISSHNSDVITPEHHEFNKKQLSELLTNYGTISELWFDMGSQSVEQSRELRELVHKLQPNCMIGSRIGNDMGDFTVMSDNQEPSYIIGVPWQSPASFFHETWGYRSWQERTDKSEKIREKLTSLVKVISRGGNYLLNIGPKGDGSVVDYERDVLLEIGNWIRRNHEAVYATDADPYYVPFDWGSVTTKGVNLYLHVLKLPSNRQIILPNTAGAVREAHILGTEIICRAKRSGKDILIELPSVVPDSLIFPVVAVQFESGYAVPPANLISAVKGQVYNSSNAFKYFSNSGIDYNTRYQSTIRELWSLNPQNNSTMTPVLYFSTEEKGKELLITTGNTSKHVSLNDAAEFALKNEISKLKWSPMYVRGPLYSGLDGVHGRIDSIDILRPWPDKNGKAWQELPVRQTGIVNKLPAEMMTAYYILQEVTSPLNQQVLIDVTRGEAVMVFLNGKQLFIHQDPLRNDSSINQVMLNLHPGTNQLLVKFFNNFGKHINAGISVSPKQSLYRLPLTAIQFRKNQPVTFSWQLARPATPHQDLMMPNLYMKLE